MEADVLLGAPLSQVHRAQPEVRPVGHFPRSPAAPAPTPSPGALVVQNVPMVGLIDTGDLDLGMLA